jgi:hypothetical protein
MTRQTFFEDPVLQSDLGDDLLQLTVLGVQIFDLVTGGLTNRVAGQALLARLEEVLALAVVQVGGDALSPAKLRDALLTTKSFKNDPDLLLRRELPSGSPADLTNCGLSRLLLLGHIETLLGRS